MNLHSDQINEISSALSKAQGENNSFKEGILIKRLLDLPEFKKDFVKRKYNKSLQSRFFDMIAFGMSECWFWVASLNKHGYGKMSSKLAHRVSWNIHYGEIPKGLQVLHKCDVPICVNPEHLFLGNHSDNMKDMANKNRAKNRINGEKNHQHRLCNDVVKKIRDLYPTIKSYRKLAILFNVSCSAIERVIRNKTWRHI